MLQPDTVRCGKTYHKEQLALYHKKLCVVKFPVLGVQ